MDALNREKAVVLSHPTKPQVVPGGVNETLYPMMEFFFDTCRAVMNLILIKTINRYPVYPAANVL